MAFKVIIAGGRDFKDYELLRSKTDLILNHYQGRGIEIVSGKAKGADTLGERYAKQMEYPVREFPADWDKWGKRAGVARNAQMAEYADALIAFWNGRSKGTADMINQMKKANKPYRVIKY